MVDRFNNPEAFFLLLLLIPALFVALKFKSGNRFTSLIIFKNLPVSLKQRLSFIPSVLLILIFCLSVLILARPQSVLEQSKKITEGVAIEMVVDRSGSMSYDFLYNGEWKQKLEISKKLFKDFITGDGDSLSGRTQDLIGLIFFGTYSETAMPLTLQHEALVDYIPFITPALSSEEGQTAIGDALMLAASRIKAYENNLSKNSGYTIKSKIIILLTDGENNAGEISPIEAAEQSAKWDVKIYTIGINGGKTSRLVSSFGSSYRQEINSNFDDSFLKEIAEISSGYYWQVKNGDELHNVYKEIDNLQKSKIVIEEYSETKELYAIPAYIDFSLVFLYIILICFVFRRTE